MHKLGDVMSTQMHSKSKVGPGGDLMPLVLLVTDTHGPDFGL